MKNQANICLQQEKKANCKICKNIQFSCETEGHLQSQYHKNHI